MSILEQLYALQDTGYADFQSGLVPNIPRERFIGVRMPNMRRLAKQMAKEDAAQAFMAAVPHTYYDENILHALLICEKRDYEACVQAIDAFLPCVDNWAVCDILSPKALSKNKPDLLNHIRRWIASAHPYTCRFGMEMLMTWFLDADFQPEYLELPAGVHSEEYYVRMMIAWFFATALAKQWDASIPYLQQPRLDRWTHNKTIQKAIESYRVPQERKAYLRTLKV